MTGTTGEPLRICFITKYPPIEGGVSAQAYWGARALAARGHRVTVVTNANQVEPDYRIAFLDGDEERLEWDAPSGGSVRVRWTSDGGRLSSFIPNGTMYTTALASIATEVARSDGADVFFANYLEPYGVAAALASSWTGVPYVIRNAGSDRTRLMANADASLAYREIFRGAAGVFTSSTSAAITMGIEPDRLLGRAPEVLPTDLFTPAAEPLDVAAVLQQLRNAGHAVRTDGAPPQGVPIIGIYGKVGDVKGSFDLLEALERVQRSGIDFSLLAMVGGRDLARFERLVDLHGLSSRTWRLPFLHHWHVPRFLRACDVVCFLEREFPVLIHRPTVPHEIFATGSVGVVSREIVSKHVWSDHIVAGETCVVVDDPRDHAQLASTLSRLLTDEAERERLSAGAGALSMLSQGIDVLGEAYEQAFTQVTASRDRQYAAPSVAETIARMMPATTLLLGDDAIEAVGGRFTPSNGLEFAAAVTTAAAQAASEVAADVGGRAGELAAFEALHVWSRTDAGALEGTSTFPPTTRPRPSSRQTVGRERGRLRPIATSDVRRLTTTFHARQVASEPVDDRAQLEKLLAEAPPATVHYLFHRPPNMFGRVFEVDADLLDLLDRCDGTTTWDEIVAAASKGDILREGRVEEVLSQLVAQSVATLR